MPPEARRPVVRLLAVTDAQYREFARAQVIEYAREKALAGDWPEGEATERSRREHAELLADRLRPAGHRFFAIVDLDGRALGWIWEGPAPLGRRVEGQRWLYQITLDESVRGRGIGRAALVALEAILAREGIRSLQLHVFRWNTIALELYRSAGYTPVCEGSSDLNLVKTFDAR